MLQGGSRGEVLNRLVRPRLLIEPQEERDAQSGDELSCSVEICCRFIFKSAQWVAQTYAPQQFWAAYAPPCSGEWFWAAYTPPWEKTLQSWTSVDGV